MSHSETCLVFDCAGEQLVGILSQAAGTPTTGVLVMVGGPQYRAGSHRQFVLLARRLAAAGFPALRFDVRGMGDSTGSPREFESLDDDIASAIDALMAAVPSLRRVVLWGLCDGASALLLYLHGRRDTRVAGLCVLNPWTRTAATEARTRLRHYYWDRLRQRDFWLKLVKGGVGVRALSALTRNLRLSATAPASPVSSASLPYTQRMALAWSSFPCPVLLVLSGRDYTAKEFLEICNVDNAWRAALHRSNVTRLDLEEADHTFSTRSDGQRVEQAVLDWLSAALPPEVPAAAVRDQQVSSAT